MAIELPMYGCTLSQPQLEEQLARYRGLAAHVVEARHTSGELTVEFADGVPEQQLERTLEVERECCSFLAIAYDRDARRLTITVEGGDHEPVLAALAAALS